jgi:hypothetical protein
MYRKGQTNLVPGGVMVPLVSIKGTAKGFSSGYLP